jgi:parallel beta-helix repeat protein/predicted outer membrane repeat protein
MSKYGVLMILMATMLFVLNAANATVWYVHPDSTLNSIQVALSYCTSDDTVLVGPGTYYENITWPNTHGIRLTSELGADTTIINAGGVARGILVHYDVDTTTVISGFTIRNGYSSYHGGGIYCDSGSSPLIMNNIITNNNGGAYGGAIRCYRSSPIISDNIIINNTAQYLGGGISCEYSQAVITLNNITDNTTTAAYGGGIACYLSSPLIEDNTIANNTANFAGGGINCSNSSAVIIDNIITGNSAGIKGGGISVYQDVSTEIIANLITQNSAVYTGGGIACEDHCSPSIRRNTISYNVVPHYGGGIYCYVYSYPTIDSCTISNNDRDGVCCALASSPVLHYNNITDNIGYGVANRDSTYTIGATENWWGDPSGPGGAGPGTGNPVSRWVEYNPWRTDSVQWTGVQEQPISKVVEDHQNLSATIFSGPLQLPEGKKCKVFDIMGRVMEPDKIRPGIYFIEVEGVVTQKVVKVR